MPGSGVVGGVWRQVVRVMSVASRWTGLAASTSTITNRLEPLHVIFTNHYRKRPRSLSQSGTIGQQCPGAITRNVQESLRKEIWDHYPQDSGINVLKHSRIIPQNLQESLGKDSGA